MRAAERPHANEFRELWVCSGRRSGKDSIASLFAAFAAAIEQGHLGRLRPGEMAHVVCIACDRDQAKIVESYTRSFFSEIDDLRRMVVRETANGIELNNRVAISIATNSFRQARGRTVLLAILDECAFYRDETSASPDLELYRALVPGGSTIPCSMLIGISSPYRRAGLLFDKWRASFGKNDDGVLVIQAPSIALNPTLDPAMIAREFEADPEAAKAEWGGEFRGDLSSFVSLELIEGSVDVGVHVRPPRTDVGEYISFVDSASGVGEDSFCACVCHRDGALIVVDALYEKSPPFSPAAVIAEASALLKAYGISSTTGDRYAPGFVAEAFGSNGIEYQFSELDRSQLYLSSLPLFTSGRVRLIDNRRLVTQLASLERRTSAIGRDVVNHPNNRHDDAANACAGALSLCSTSADDVVRQFVRAWGDIAAFDKERAA